MTWFATALRRPNARSTGIVYLFYFLVAIFAQFLTSRKLAYGDAVNVLATAFYVVLTLLFYGMFKPVNRSLSLLASLFSLAGCLVMTLGFFPRTELPISPLVFFGPYCLLIGYLIWRSIFLPRALGLLMACAGIGWLAFLIPVIAHNLSLSLEILGVVAEASLMLWLIVMGVNVERWKQQANRAERPPLVETATGVRGGGLYRKERV